MSFFGSICNFIREEYDKYFNPTTSKQSSIPSSNQPLNMSIFRVKKDENANFTTYRQRSGSSSDQYNKGSIFNGYLDDDKDAINTVDTLEKSFDGYIDKYPNLKDNLENIDSIYALKDKQNVDKTNLPYENKEWAKTNEFGGYYNAYSDSIVVMKSSEEYEKSTLAHEIGHSLDYKDANNNGKIDLDEVNLENYGGFSNSDTYKQAYLEDLKNTQTKYNDFDFMIKNSDQTHKSYGKIDYATQDTNFSDGIDEKDITSKGLKENLAVMTECNLENDQDESELMKKLFPNCYSLTEEHLKSS